MFIQEKKSSSKVSSGLFRIIIVLVAAYATYHRIVLHDPSKIYLWIIGVVLVLAFIFDQVSRKGYSALEYFEAERARRKSRIENIVISIFLAFVFGAVIMAKFGKDDLGWIL